LPFGQKDRQDGESSLQNSGPVSGTDGWGRAMVKETDGPLPVIYRKENPLGAPHILDI